jgi:hypothetical protein
MGGNAKLGIASETVLRPQPVKGGSIGLRPNKCALGFFGAKLAGNSDLLTYPI